MYLSNRDVSKIETALEQQKQEVKPPQHVPALLKKRKRSSAEVMNLDPHQLPSVVDLPVPMVTTASSLASELLKLYDISSPSTKPVSIEASNFEAGRKLDKPVAVVEVAQAEPGALSSVTTLHLQITDDQQQSVDNVYQSEQPQNQEPFIPPLVDVKVKFYCHQLTSSPIVSSFPS